MRYMILHHYVPIEYGLGFSQTRDISQYDEPVMFRSKYVEPYGVRSALVKSMFY